MMRMILMILLGDARLASDLTPCGRYYCYRSRGFKSFAELQQQFRQAAVPWEVWVAIDMAVREVERGSVDRCSERR